MGIPMHYSELITVEQKKNQGAIAAFLPIFLSSSYGTLKK
jgi:hypothetical protein